jgi:peptidoglycan/LPS O-acetylase OafA/YrhL
VTPAAPGRLRQLDGLRGIAVAMVVWHHLWPVPTLQVFDAEFGRYDTWHPPLGHLGVSLFFVLSGFLITKILLDARERVAVGGTRRRELRDFYIRRSLRIFPAYYATLLLMTMLAVPKFGERFWWHATYLSNWFLSVHPGEGSDTRGGVDRHLWTLAVEEQFYLLWPALILFLPRKWLMPGVLAAIAVGPIWRAFVWLPAYEGWRRGWLEPMHEALPPESLPWPVSEMYRSWSQGLWGRWHEFPVFANADLLAAGGIVALLWGSRRFLTYALVAAIAGGASVLFLLWPRAGNDIITLRVIGNNAAVALCFAGVVGLVARGLPGVAGRLLSWRPLVGLGTISYGVYLLHFPAGWLARHTTVRLGLGEGVWLVAVTGTLLTLVLSLTSWFLLERPCNRLKDRFAPKRPRNEARP